MTLDTHMKSLTAAFALSIFAEEVSGVYRVVRGIECVCCEWEEEVMLEKESL